jgi:sulfofructose kinase
MAAMTAPKEPSAAEREPRSVPAVVGIGCAALDYLGIVPAMPRFDDAESMKPGEWLMSGGGPVATALVTLARLGVSAAYVGVLGDEMVGHEIRRELAMEGVGVNLLRHQVGARSLTALVLVEAGTGRRAFVTFHDGRRGFELTPADRRAIQQARILHLDGWYPDAGLHAARLAREAGVLVSVDAYAVTPETDEWMTVSDAVICNESFPRRYTGCESLAEAVDVLLQKGPRLAVVTLSEQGCLVATRERRFHMPGFSVPVVDTTGAGDAFHGAFLYGLLQEWDLADIARFANAVGALTCRKLGGRASIPDLDEVECFLGQRPRAAARPA